MIRTVTFSIDMILPLSEDEIVEELLLAETRMNAESRLRFHLKEHPSKVEALENKIEAYKFICEQAEVPKFVVDNPEVFKPQPTTREDKKWVRQTIKKFREHK